MPRARPGPPTVDTSPIRRTAPANGTSTQCTWTGPTSGSSSREMRQAPRGRRACRDKIGLNSLRRARGSVRQPKGGRMKVRRWHLAVLPLLISSLVLVGCAKRPSMVQASAPAPAGSAAAGVSTSEEASQSGAGSTGSEGTAPAVAAPSPTEVSSNAGATASGATTSSAAQPAAGAKEESGSGAATGGGTTVTGPAGPASGAGPESGAGTPAGAGSTDGAAESST